jgi:hypothetical protein
MRFGNKDAILSEEYSYPAHAVVYVVYVREDIVRDNDFCLTVLFSDSPSDRLAEKRRESRNTAFSRECREILCRVNAEHAAPTYKRGKKRAVV